MYGLRGTKVADIEWPLDNEEAVVAMPMDKAAELNVPQYEGSMCTVATHLSQEQCAYYFVGGEIISQQELPSCSTEPTNEKTPSTPLLFHCL